MNNKGFSLIEACIALVIIGLLMAPVIVEYNNHIYMWRKNITAANSFAVQSAIEAYYNQYDRFPCPASLTRKIGDADYGREAVPDTAESCIPPGLSPGKCEDGVCLSPTGQVLHGAVPFVEIKLNEDKILDAWDNKFSYVMGVDIGRRPSTAPAPTSGSVPVMTTSGGGASVIPRGIRFALIISHGPNGRGAFNRDGINAEAFPNAGIGAMQAPCEPDIDLDSMNCSNSGTYLATGERGSLEGNQQYYDDRVVEIVRLPSDAWNPIEDNPKSVTTNMAVGIGTREVGVKLRPNGQVLIEPGASWPTQHTERIGLDVADSIRADRLKMEEVCDVVGENCFSSRVLAGSGYIDCRTDQAAMTGISQSKANCSQNIKINGTPKNCPSKRVIGINNGVIICAP